MSMYEVLADYLGGALDAETEQVVAARIASDPVWQAAYEELVAADAAVRMDLGMLTAEPIDLPSDVAERISAALAAAAAAETQPDAAAEDSTQQERSASPILAPADRRKSRWALAGGAAVVTGLAVIGAGFLFTMSPSGTDTASLSEERMAASQPAPAAAPPQLPGTEKERESQPDDASGLQVWASGRDYTRQELAGSRAAMTAPEGESPPVPPELRRLREPEALDACLRQVSAVHGAEVTSVDFARFEGQAAVIVLLGGGGDSLVVGPRCGLGGIDKLYPVP